MNKRIFISSTCFDLIDLRAELKIFLEQLGFIPVMSDHHNSHFETYPDQNSIETCLVNLRSCESVIIILSQRYGGNLSKAGFGDYSATHLEYLEAIKEKKKILFFVRDRLESDYNIFNKAKSTANLSWIQEKDIKIFELLDNHKKLTNKNIDNWYWTYKNVIDIKERLSIELKSDIKAIRLDELISSGNIPFITITSFGEIINNESFKINFKIYNVGNQTAIEPLFILYRANNYAEVERKKLLSTIGGYTLNVLTPLFSNSSVEIIKNDIMITQEEKEKNETNLVVEVIYKTIHGDLLSDVLEIRIRTLLRPTLEIVSRHTSKRYINDKIYKKIISNKN